MEKENTWSGVNFLHTYWNRLKHHFDILSHKSIVVVVASYRNSNWNTIREEKHRRALMKIFFTINEYSNSLLYFCSTAQIYKIIDINTYKIYIYIYKYIYIGFVSVSSESKNELNTRMENERLWVEHFIHTNQYIFHKCSSISTGF